MKSEPGSVQLPDALRCPITGAKLELDPDREWVRAVGQPYRYPIRGGIPVLVASAAQPVEDGSRSTG
ncbi:MAG: Trm112 family protein [Planctomycetota bacterium]